MSVPTFMLSPPYRKASPAPNPRGAILAIRPFPDLGTDALSSYIATVQQRVPHITIILWLDLIGRESIADLVVTASRHAIRGFVITDVPDPDHLRRFVTNPTSLAGDIAYRLRAFGYEVDDPIADLIHSACAHAVECRTVKQVTDAAALKYDRLLRLLRQRHLGTPASLYQILRLLLVAVQLQHDPLARISDVSTHYHFYDEAALRARFRESFGVSPSVVRSWLGWEYLLFIAMRRAGLWRAARLQVR